MFKHNFASLCVKLFVVFETYSETSGCILYRLYFYIFILVYKYGHTLVEKKELELEAYPKTYDKIG